MTKQQQIASFLTKISKHENGCWLWTGAIGSRGYGVFSSKLIPSKRAHRFSFAAFVEPIKKGNVICHRCDNPPCVNPEHLFQGTHAENMLDAIQKGRLTGPSEVARKPRTERSKARTKEIEHLRNELAQAREEIEMLRHLVQFLTQ
jgi:hypothetical protein